jgi:hypothetical protein
MQRNVLIETLNKTLLNPTIVRIVKWGTSTYFKGVILTTLSDTVVVGILLHLVQVHLIWENTSS